MKLPGWVIDDADSVRREALPFQAMSPKERLRATGRACRAAARLASLHADRRALDYRDPLPQSTIDALERLRRGGTFSR